MRRLLLKLLKFTVTLFAFFPATGQQLSRTAARVQADPAYSKIYWSNYDGNAIERTNLDGTNRETIVANIASSASPGSFAMEVDVVNQKVYFYNQGTDAIERQNFDGTGRETVVSGSGFSYMMVLDVPDAKVYWANFEAGLLEEVNFDGSGRTTLIGNIGSGNNGPVAFEVDLLNRKIYWFDPLGLVLKRANLDGSGEETFLTQTGYIYTMTIDKQNQKLYWANFDANTIERVNLNGTGREVVVSAATSSIDPGAGPITFTLDNVNSKIYWHDAGLNAIRRGNLNNTGKEIIIANSGFIYAMIIPVEDAISLPIALKSFKAEQQNDVVLLDWATSKEINAAAFDLERAVNSRTFSRIATISANNKDGIYHYADNQITRGNNYLYRLKMRDIDGSFQYSPVVSVNTTFTTAVREFTLFPNPVLSSGIHLKSNTSGRNNVQVIITDRTGRLVYTGIHKNTNGQYTVAVTGLTPGIYMLRISDDNDKLLQVLPFVK